LQAADAVHDTMDRLLAVAPAVLGVGWMAQDAPFQASAKVVAMPELV
jgi:hypothetical protein